MKFPWRFLLAYLAFHAGVKAQPVNFKDSTQKFYRLESYQKGLTVSKQWVRSLSQGKKSKSPEMGEALTWLGFFQTETRKAKVADSAFVAAFSIFNSMPGNDSLIAKATLFHANLKIYTEPDKAANLTQEAISKLEKVYGPVHPLVALGYKQLGNIYRGLETGIANMQPALQKAIAIQTQISGAASDEVLQMKNELGNYLAQAGYAEEGLLYIDSCLSYWLAKGSKKEKSAQLMVDKANVVDGMGRYKEADSLYNRAIDIEKKLVPVSKNRLANIYYSFAQFQKAHGELTKAEFYFLKCVEFTKALPKEEQHLVWPLQFLAVLYKDLNDFKKAEEYALACIAEIEQTVGSSPHLRVPYMVLSDVYGILYKDKKRQEEYVWKQYEVYKKFLGPNSDGTAQALLSVGGFYLNAGQLHKADSIFLKVRERFQSGGMRPTHSVWLSFARGAERLNRFRGKSDSSEYWVKKGLEIARANFPPQNEMFGNYLGETGVHYWCLGKDKEAGDYFQKANDILKINIAHNSASFSDQQRTLFWKGKEKFLDHYQTFCVAHGGKDPAMLDALFNNRLFTKSFLLHSSAKWKHRIRTSGDKKLQNLFNQWEELRSKIGKMERENGARANPELDSLLRISDALEKDLSSRSEFFATLADKKMYSWKEVQNQLKPGEAAVEMVRIKKFGVAAKMKDLSGEKPEEYAITGLTDTVYYAALIVKPGLLHPELVVLTDGNNLEGGNEKYYRNCIQKQLPDQKSYNAYWRKIGVKLEPGIRRVYFSPDGVFHNINFGTLLNLQTQKYLLDELDIRVVTSTKDLIVSSKEEELNTLAYLIGHPDYDNGGIQNEGIAGLQRSAGEGYRFGGLDLPAFNDLPGTKAEVESISKIMRNKGWTVQELMENEALEENLKGAFKPRVLHIATHGFFQADTTLGYNPLLRSGIILAGANKFLKGELADSQEDGILTAYEAMNLNLDNTDLVVLSACETGLGEIKNGEGVYGLQRAFKVAGARSIIMSLWKVDDEATQELMVSFYKNWLGSSAVSATGQTPNGAQTRLAKGANGKRAAFLKAQKELKSKYHNPYYWGAFVMVGE